MDRLRRKISQGIAVTGSLSILPIELATVIASTGSKTKASTSLGVAANRQAQKINRLALRLLSKPNIASSLDLKPEERLKLAIDLLMKFCDCNSPEELYRLGFKNIIKKLARGMQQAVTKVVSIKVNSKGTSVTDRPDPISKRPTTSSTLTRRRDLLRSLGLVHNKRPIIRSDEAV